MTRQLIAEALLRIYSAAWRREYGDELMDILVERPMTIRIVTDVISAALLHRARTAAPSTVLGLASMLVVFAGVVLTPTRYGSSATAVLTPASIAFPTFTVTFVASEVYAVLLIVCGWWTRRRFGYSPRSCGLAAMWMSLIAGLPVIVAGVLLALGAIDVTFVSAGSARPLPLAAIIAPIARLPEAWIWGALGGSVGKRWLRFPVPASR